MYREDNIVGVDTGWVLRQPNNLELCDNSERKQVG